jgi:hypothetical protein
MKIYKIAIKYDEYHNVHYIIKKRVFLLFFKKLINTMQQDYAIAKFDELIAAEAIASKFNNPPKQ